MGDAIDPVPEPLRPRDFAVLLLSSGDLTPRQRARDQVADRAGLKSGDVIRSANGKPIVSSGDLPAIVGLSQPGDKLAMDVWRQGKEVHLSAELARSGVPFEHGPRNQPWMWREARLRDPDGNIIFLYKAGEARRFPPWRVE